MKPINFFPPINPRESKKLESIISIIMPLFFILWEAPALYQLFYYALGVNPYENNSLESQQQTIAKNQEQCSLLKEQVSTLTTITHAWCHVFTCLSTILHAAQDTFAIQHLHIDTQTATVTGLIEHHNTAALGTLIAALDAYNLGFTTTAYNSSYYLFKLTTQEAVDGTLEPTYAKQNTIALSNTTHDQNKTTSIT